MITIHPDSFREKSKELYDKVESSNELKRPYRRYAGDSLAYLKQAILLMTLHVPKEQWTSEDYARVMRCYQFAMSICIETCKYNVECFRHVLASNQIDKTSLSNININFSVMNDYLRDAAALYKASIPENKDNLEFHLSANAVQLEYYRHYASGDLVLKSAANGFAEELQTAITYMEKQSLPVLEKKIKTRKLTSFPPAQLKTLAECYKSISDIYLLAHQYDLALIYIMKMCEAINALPSPTNHYHPEKDTKSHDEIFLMHGAYAHFMEVFPESNDERCSHMKELLRLAVDFLQWHNNLTPLHVEVYYNEICKLDVKTSLLQRQFLKHILKSILDNCHNHVMSKNNLAMAVVEHQYWAKEFGEMITQLDKLEANPRHTPTLFKPGGIFESDSDSKAKPRKQARISVR